MNILLFISDAVIPILIFSIVGYGLLNHHNIYDDFIKGAKDGFQTVIGIMPTLIGLMVGVGILRASGFLDLLSSLLGIITEPLHFPAELVPVSIVKMFSSSAATFYLSIFPLLKCGTICMPSLMHQNDHCMHRGRVLIGHAREFGSARNMDDT